MHGAILGVTLVAKESPNFAREMEAIFRQSQLLLMQRTESGRILRASTKMAELLGIPLPELLGQNIKDVVPVTAAGWLLSKDQDLLDGPDAHTSEVVKLQVSEDMPPLWFSVERFEYQGTAERERSVITVATDITELQVARQDAETMLSQLRLLQDFANVGYWSLDVASGAVDWSDEVCRIHDVNPGTNPRDLDAGIAYYHPDDADRVATLVSDAITKNAPFEFKARLVRSNGDVVPVEARGLPVTQEDGTVVQLVGIFRKIAQDAPA
jgi:two-component system CheB/CheR fusion protein